MRRPTSFRPTGTQQIIDGRERLLKRKWTRQDLQEYEIEIRDLYFQIREAILNPETARAAEDDGDPLELTTLRFALAIPIAEAFERLLPLATIDGEQHVSDVEHDVSGAMTHADMSWVKAGNRKHATWDNTILGRLVLDPGVLVAEVTTRPGARNASRARFRRCLDDAVRLVDRSVHDLEADLRGGRRTRGREPRPDMRSRPMTCFPRPNSRR